MVTSSKTFVYHCCHPGFRVIFLSTHASAAVILSGNLATITAGTETASGNTWLAGSFGPASMYSHH